MYNWHSEVFGNEEEMIIHGGIVVHITKGKLLDDLQLWDWRVCFDVNIIKSLEDAKKINYISGQAFDHFNRDMAKNEAINFAKSRHCIKTNNLEKYISRSNLK